ncbi:4-(cytidine 5'-diphospho)-2-C-methyl-D-erythritol kinase [Bifidobacterium gallicum]|nr:4-(cytidine 5'-diphospho)-2-C-methyl-D-erythritol kinase [Bifidobacterium gallicum]KFI60126.1 4-diphosphocytidyl-2C-methyl-D-erythritol kinase [Bifidobacterium gallicum DSM 20093 = LMG 11596]
MNVDMNLRDRTRGLAVRVDGPAKTNLTLHVGARREEWGGRHELDTVYCALGIYDTVTVAAKQPGIGFSLDITGRHLGDLASSSADLRRNHAVLALFALAEAAGREPDVSIRIDKRIPVGAGMGGGSVDAAATLLALNELWGLNWSIDELQPVAAQLGADMPFCLAGGYARGTGFGEHIEPLDANSDLVRELREQGFAGEVVVAAYRAELPTPEVYTSFDVLGGDGFNDLQRAAVSLHPRSGQAIEAALAAGATQAFVSGSGPSVVAFVPNAAVRQAVCDAWRTGNLADRIIMATAPAYPIIHRDVPVDN